MTREKLIEEAKLRLFMGEQQFPTKWSDVAELAADFALQVLERSIYREICEAATFIYFGDMRIMCLFDGKYEAVNTQRPMRDPRVFDTLAEAFEWVKGGRR